MSVELWFPGLGTRPFASHRVFCFPYAGGTPRAYKVLQDAAPDWLEIVPVLLPGRDARVAEKPFDNIDDFLAGMLPSLAPYLTGSFGMIGYSMGARLAYRLTHHLGNLGLSQPRYLMVCAHSYPTHQAPQEVIHTLPRGPFWDRISRYGATPSEIRDHPELMDLLEPMLRGDFEMAFEPLPQPLRPLCIPIVAISGRGDQYASPEAMSDWRQETTGAFISEPLDGDHFFIHSAPNLFAETVIRNITKVVSY